MEQTSAISSHYDFIIHFVVRLTTQWDKTDIVLKTVCKNCTTRKKKYPQCSTQTSETTVVPVSGPLDVL